MIVGWLITDQDFIINQIKQLNRVPCRGIGFLMLWTTVESNKFSKAYWSNDEEAVNKVLIF